MWQADERKAAQVPEGAGWAFSYNRLVNERWLPYFRPGYSDSGGGAFLDRSLSAGFGYFPTSRSDTLGVGVNWGRPSEEIYGPDVDDQYTAEVFLPLPVISAHDDDTGYSVFEESRTVP